GDRAHDAGPGYPHRRSTAEDDAVLKGAVLLAMECDQVERPFPSKTRSGRAAGRRRMRSRIERRSNTTAGSGIRAGDAWPSRGERRPISAWTHRRDGSRRLLWRGKGARAMN